MKRFVRAWMRLFCLVTLAWSVSAPLHLYAQDDLVPPSGDAEAFVEATVDVANPYVGQQIIYVFKYYEAVNANVLPGLLSGQPDYEAPEFSNFWKEGEVEQTSYQEERNGRTYNVSELHTTIFPTLAGQLTIGPARLLLSDLPGLVQRQLQTLPVTINVQPVPAGAPTGFTGAVGTYTLGAQVDRLSTTVGEPIRLVLTVGGVGNITMAPEPQLPSLDTWRVVQDTVESTPSVDANGVVGGVKSVSYLLFPNQAGSSTLPAIEYPFFDPQTGSFRSALTTPIALEVEAVANPSPAAQSPADAAAAAPVAEEAAAQKSAAESAADPAAQAGLMPLLQVPARLRMAVAPLAGQPWYWVLWLLPLAAVALAGWKTLGERRGQHRRTANPGKSAAQDALRSLAAEPARPLSPADQCGRAQRTLLDYLNLKLGQPVTGRTRPALAAQLAGKGVPAQLTERVLTFLRLGDGVRYSPATVDAHMAAQMQQQVEALIRDLDKVIQ